MLNINDVLERIKKYFWLENQEGEGKRFNTQLLILLFAGILLMLFSSVLDFTRDVSPAPPPGQDQEVLASKVEMEREPLVRELTEILNQIKGVSDVSVFLTMDSGPEYNYAQNFEQSQRDTQEKDNQGGSRGISEKEENNSYVVIRDSQGGERPLLIKEVKPQVRGALVVAHGVDNAILKKQVVEALQSTLGLPAHRIAVLPK